MSIDNTSVCIAGTNIAAWELARLLGIKAVPTTLLCHSQYPGGIFRGVECDGTRFDTGLVVIERFASNRDDSADLRSYLPSVRNDYGRFFRYVEYSLESLSLKTKEREKPELVFEGHIIPDFLSGDRLSGLQSLPPPMQRMMKAELEEILRRPESPLHPRGKSLKPGFSSASLSQVSRENHGTTFHKHFIQPFVEKAFGKDSSGVLGLYHRVLWLPLFYPETLLAGLTGEPQGLNESVFHDVENGLVADFARRLEEAVVASPSVQWEKRIIEKVDLTRPDETTIHFTQGEPIRTSRFIWAGEPDELRRLATGETQPKPERATLSILFALLPCGFLKRAFASLLLPESKSLFFRACIQGDAVPSSSGEAFRLVFEFNPGNVKETLTPLEVKDAALRVLKSAGLVSEEADFSGFWLKRFPNSILLPTMENLKKYSSDIFWAENNAPTVLRMGNSLGFGCNAFNEQIVQAYYLSEVIA